VGSPGGVKWRLEHVSSRLDTAKAAVGTLEGFGVPDSGLFTPVSIEEAAFFNAAAASPWGLEAAAFSESTNGAAGEEQRLIEAAIAASLADGERRDSQQRGEAQQGGGGEQGGGEQEEIAAAIAMSLKQQQQQHGQGSSTRPAETEEQRQLEAALAMSLGPPATVGPSLTAAGSEIHEEAAMERAIQRSLVEKSKPPRRETETQPDEKEPSMAAKQFSVPLQNYNPFHAAAPSPTPSLPPASSGSIVVGVQEEDHLTRMKRLKEEWKREREAGPGKEEVKPESRRVQPLKAPASIDLCSPPVVNLCDSSDDDLEDMYT